MAEATRAKNLYECHVFVCTNKREGGRESCADKGSVAIRDHLKTWAKEKYGRRVRINTSGCLDFCEKGIVSVIYPDGEWFMNLNAENLEEIKNAISLRMDFNQ